MPTYKIKAPDGNTYSIQGPEGATDEQVREQVLKQHPTASGAAAPAAPRRKLTTETPTYDPTEGMSFVEKALAGAGGRAVDMYRGAKQTFNIGDQAELQKEIDQAKQLDAPLKDTAGGMVGSAATDIASFALPGGALGAAGKLLPKVLSKIPMVGGALGELAGATAAGSGAAAKGVQAAKAAADPVVQALLKVPGAGEGGEGRVGGCSPPPR